MKSDVTGPLDPQPEAPAAPTAGRLPQQLTTFVGRQRELAELGAALPEHRMVTICGPGGAGKTRLALAVGERMLSRYRDGLFLVELADLADPLLVPSTVAIACGVPERAELGLERTLVEAFRGARVLIVLDNCEHLLDACAELAFALLQSCPRLQVLATSRDPLQVPGELAWRVPPLPRPSVEEPPGGLSQLAGYDSVRLFCERARTFRPAFALTPDNAEAVIRICDLTDGIPLAIELAAGRLVTMDVEEIASQLDDLLGLLDRGAGRGPDRHRTLRAAIGWSYDRLGRAERLLFARFSVFAGPAGLEAVGAVCAGDGLLAAEVPDTVAGLVDRSLLQAEAGGGEVRFRLLETMRQFALEKLAGRGELEAVRSRHAAHYAQVADTACRAQARGEVTTWARRLTEEQPQLRAALAWALREDARLALRLAAALSWFWHTVSNLAEGRRWLDRALAGRVDEPGLRARALHGAGRIAYRQGDNGTARRLFEEALRLQRPLGREQGAARVLRSLGLALLSEGDYDGARARLEEALEIHRRLDVRLDQERTLGSLGLVALADRDHATARGRLEEAVAIAREIGDEWGMATSTGSLGELELELGNLQPARAEMEASLRALLPIGDWGGVAYRLEGLARVAAARGDAEAALTVAAAAAALRHRTGQSAAPHWRRRLEEALDSCRDSLPAPETAAAEARGGRLDAGQGASLAFALSLPTAGGHTAGAAAPPPWASPVARAAGLDSLEWEALGLIIVGLPNGVIGQRLGRRPADTRRLVTAVLGKLGARTRQEAVMRALGLELGG